MLVKIAKNIIGELDPENHLFTKQVKKSKHLFQKFDSWGIDAQYFTDVLLPMNYNIHIYDGDERLLYKVDAKTWEKNAYYFHFKKGKTDHRAQIFLPRRFFQIVSYQR